MNVQARRTVPQSVSINYTVYSMQRQRLYCTAPGIILGCKLARALLKVSDQRRHKLNSLYFYTFQVFLKNYL